MDAAELIPAYARAELPVLPLHSIDPETARCTCLPMCWRCARYGFDPDCQCAVRECTRNAAKHPRTRHGKDDATTDLGQIAEWFGLWPDCNWGIRPPVGTIVLDIDPRNGGDVTLAALLAEHGDLPPTLTARTGSGGQHIWLSYNGPARGKLGEGIDVKSHGGYVVAPPSVHASGGRYEWTDQRSAAYAPGWVKAILNPPVTIRHGRRSGGSGDALARFVESRAYGEINDAVYWAACRAAEGGILDDLLERLVAAAGTAAGTRASQAGEIQTRRTIESARHAPQRADAPRKAV